MVTVMKKILPYVFSLMVGAVFGYLLFNSREVSSAFKEEVSATGFQLGVFNSVDLAKDYVKKYPASIIISDDDVYRVYYSILTNDSVINKMEDYLNDKKISFYKKDITISDKGLINALSDYEQTMLDVSSDTFASINKLIMESYGGNI
jgi:hypothetical protein